MKEISLSRGLCAIVDDHWFEYLSQWKWCTVVWDKSFYYAARFDKETKKMVFMHRIVSKTPKELHCDHINHNTLDNRESNLRNVTPQQNAMNRRVHKDNRLGIKGISLDRGRYRATIRLNGKRVFDKAFATLEEAKKAYQDAAEKYQGEYRCR